MSTKAILIASAVFGVAVALQIPAIISQQHGRRATANLIDLGLSVVGVSACVIVMLIKNAKVRNSGQ